MKNETLTVIPQLDHGLIVEISGNTVKPISQLDIPYNSIGKIINNETIVTLDKENKQLLLHNMDGSLIRSMDVPFGMAMNVKEKVVYVGGNASNGEVCYMVDLGSEVQTLQNIKLPEPMVWGKAVDDILILGNKMMLIDNIVYPKYTFEYDISIANKPMWVRTIELPEGRAYEDIIKGDMNDDWMVYFSTSSSGYTGNASHISIEGKKEIVLTVSGESYSDKDRPYFWYKDICLIGDILYVLTDIGLGYYNLLLSNIHSDDIKFVEHNIVADRIIKIDDTRLLLVDKYGYELIYLGDVKRFNGTVMDKFWNYDSINLKNRGLKTFPEEMKNFKTIQHLDLSDNDIKTFPESLRKCKQLRSLNLHRSGITQIPDWIEEFEHLEYLNISSINIDNPIPFMASRIKLPKSIKYLNLRYCQIDAIPQSVFELEELEYLNLLENHISKIPDKIRNLKKLKTLKLSWGDIRSISDGIKELQLLEKLEMDYTNGKFPKAIYSLVNLKKIDARGKSIRKITSEIKNLTKLEHLDLSGNDDLKLAKNIGDLANLKTLDLSGCNLKVLPKSICKLTNLRKLNLRNNELESLPKSMFEKLTKLEFLVLSGNKLNQIPKEIKHLSKLGTFAIGRNKINEFPIELCKLYNLNNLYLNDNYFTALPNDIVNLKNISFIDITGNDILLTAEQRVWVDKLMPVDE